MSQNSIRLDLESARNNRNEAVDVYISKIIRTHKPIASKILAFLVANWDNGYLLFSKHPEWVFSPQELETEVVSELIALCSTKNTVIQ